MSGATSQYCYQDLIPGPDSIRLLRLLPSEDEDANIQCQLFDYSLQDLGKRSHPYEALSYVWGKLGKTLSIFVDKLDLPVTPSLYEALIRLRHRYIERIIWVDAICINQENQREKEQQILSMAKIYSQASCVVVWLGEAADNSDLALEEICIAAGGRMDSQSSNKNVAGKALLALLQRPWFRRIWVLQEVAAARHVLISCGLTEVDGYAFCMGVESLMAFYNTQPDLQSLIRSVIYQIRGAVFRPKGSGRGFQDMYPLSELVDMYHTHEATLRHDKVYALLGMSSDDLGKAGLLPDYNVPWQNLFETLIRNLLCTEISVKILPDGETALIKSECFILGKVSYVSDSIGLNGRQAVNVIWSIKLERSASEVELAGHWTLQPGAKPLMRGDVICLLHGVSNPTIIRSCGSHWAIILVTVDLPHMKQASIDKGFDWTKLLQSKEVRPRNVQLVWDWTNLPGKLQGQGDCEDSEELSGQLIRLWSSALVFGDVEEYEKSEEMFRKAMKGYELGYMKECMHDTETNPPFLMNVADLDMMNRYYGQPPLSWAAEKGYESVVHVLLKSDKSNVDILERDGRTPLYWAAKAGHLTIVERLLQEKVKVNAGIGRAGEVALQIAAGGGYLAVVERLLEEKVDVNSVSGQEGRTALQSAAAGGHFAVVERLLQDKAEVNAEGSAAQGGRTALQAAAEGGHLTVVERLLQEMAEVNAEATERGGRTALQAAAGGGHLVVVERLLQENAEVNAPGATIQGGRTALQAAAEGGHFAVVERLLQEKANFNAPAEDRGGRTALQAAAEGGHFSVVERLLQEKASVNALAGARGGKTALQAAAGGGHLMIVERLLREKANVNAEAATQGGRTALQAAAEGDHLAVVERLLQEMADIDEEISFYGGRTALQAASGGGSLTVVQRLLQENEDVNTPAGNEAGRTALQAAAEGGHLAVVERLLQEKAEVNAPAARLGGRTALQAAAGEGHLAIVERLLQEKAEVNAPGATIQGSRTALQAAAEGGHLAVVERLLQEKAYVNAEASMYDGKTALQAAAGRGHLSVVERLLQEKANVNAEAGGWDGRTALQAAAKGGHLAVVERLLQGKADVRTRAAKAGGSGGRTAIQEAADGGHLAVVERLRQSSAAEYY